MDNAPPDRLAQDVAAALDWWREAGVGHAFHDQPAQWLSPSRPTAVEGARARAVLREAPPAAPAAADTLDPARWPRTLAGFADWWLTDPALDDGRTGGRVPPRGVHDPLLMILVDEPESDDGTRLLAGPSGMLLDRMLAAMGLAPEQVYIASALPRHMPMADWLALATRGFGRLLAHHIALVQPQRIVAFGANVLPLLGHTPTHSAATTIVFNHDAMQRPMLVVRALPLLLARPQWKSEVWQAWLEWTRTDRAG